ncbi:MAG: hypothetical protein AYK18_15165 [Theionarchaea archaeon DG-70]|nr:MAG: hypothetical protein AYK18_15165 [Theionarchaea archaeon DG-70]
MNIELTLAQMALLDKEINREVLRLLLQGDKSFNSLCRDINKSRSAIFTCLKDLQKTKMVGRRRIMDEKKGRPGYEYYIKNFHIPELTRTNFLDFLNGKDVSSKFLTLTEISAIDDLSRYMPVSIESFLNLMLSSGIAFKYAIQMMVELGSHLEKNISYDELISETLGIIKEKYPIENSVIERFKNRATEELKVLSKSGAMDLTMEKAEKIVAKELEIERFEAKYIASNILVALRLLGISEIPYTTLVNLMYIFMENIGIPCRRTPHFYNVAKFPDLESSAVTVIVKNKKKKWSLINFSDYLLRNKNLEKNKCNFLAYLMIEKLLILGLEEYSIEFVDLLSRELFRQFNI